MCPKAIVKGLSDWGAPWSLFKCNVVNITILNSITSRPLFIGYINDIYIHKNYIHIYINWSPSPHLKPDRRPWIRHSCCTRSSTRASGTKRQAETWAASDGQRWHNRDCQWTDKMGFQLAACVEARETAHLHGSTGSKSSYQTRALSNANDRRDCHTTQ